jgi:hypothetical protein
VPAAGVRVGAAVAPAGALLLPPDARGASVQRAIALGATSTVLLATVALVGVLLVSPTA